MKKEFKKGDVVKVKRFKKRPHHWCHSMDYLMGQEVTIIKVYEETVGTYDVRDILDPNDYWWMRLEDFDFVNIQEPELNVIL